jgi:hypothetical protein
MIEKLKNLAPKQCKYIASVAVPNVDWVFIESRSPWKGFDCIEDGFSEGDSPLVFQIDYRPDEELENINDRFRFYVDLELYPLSSDKIKAINLYLDTL